MGTSKRKRAQPAPKKLIAQRAKLQKLGFLKKGRLGKNVTPSQKRALKKYADVLTGKATVITAKNKKQAARFKKSFQVKGDKIIVPKVKGEKVLFDTDAGLLSTRRKVGNKTIVKRIALGELENLPKGQFYVVPFGGGQKYRFNSLPTMIDFMLAYERKETNPYKDWRKYVEIEDVESAEGDEYTPTKSHRSRVLKGKFTARQKKRRKG